MGPRSARVPPPSAPGRSVGEVHSSEPRHAAGDPADGRHFLPEAMDGRDARGPQLHERRADGQTVPDLAASGLSGPAAQDRPLVLRRSVPGDGRRTVTTPSAASCASCAGGRRRCRRRRSGWLKLQRVTCESDLQSRFTGGNRGAGDSCKRAQRS